MPRNGIILIADTTYTEKELSAFNTMVERLSARLHPEKLVGAAVLDETGEIFTQTLKLLKDRGCEFVQVTPAQLHASESLMVKIAGVMWMAQQQVSNVRMELIQPDAHWLDLEDYWFDKLWPAFAQERTQPPTGSEIEQRSHAIINQRLNACPCLDDRTKAVIRRVVHSAADFSFATTLRIHRDAIKQGIDAIKSGCNIFCDVNMLRAGITHATDCNVLCRIKDQDVIDYAKTNNTTRAAAAIELEAKNLDGAIVAVGNAPTALWKIMALSRKPNGPKPALVVGIPVGFVGATEAKMALFDSDLTFITNLGPKGGSPVTAAAVNAIASLAKED